MENPTTYLNDMFTQFQRYYGDDWQIDRASWLAWWNASGRAEEKSSNSYGVRCRRVDKRKPWTIDNITIQTAAAIGEKTTAQRKSGILTVQEWLAEVRHK